MMRERGTPSSLEQRWDALEVWTLNRIYSLDSELVCLAVRDRISGRQLDHHEALGAKLVGGQLRAPSGAIERVTHPFPIAGDAAVFVQKLGKRLKYAETSEVVRVIVRQRVLEVGPGNTAPSWDSMARRKWGA